MNTYQQEYAEKLYLLFPKGLADQIAEDTNICPECGGNMVTTTDNSDEYETYVIDTCEDCHYEQA